MKNYDREYERRAEEEEELRKERAWREHSDLLGLRRKVMREEEYRYYRHGGR